MSTELAEFKSKLDEIKDTSSEKKSSNILGSIFSTITSKTYRIYSLTVLVVFVLLILLKPKDIRNKEIDEKTGNINVKGINIMKFLKKFAIFSVIACIAVYLYFNFMNKKGGCKLCGK
jgi:hypothetical protein